jgi:predicted HTH domain antitoxin
MTNLVVTFQIPQDVYLTLQSHGLFRETLAEHSRRLLALRFYQEHILSLGKACALAGIGRWQFIEFLSENNVPIIDYSDEELATEFKSVEQLAADLEKRSSFLMQHPSLRWPR